MSRVRYRSYTWGEGRYLRLRDPWSDEDLEDFVWGRTRELVDRHIPNWQEAQRLRTEWAHYLEELCGNFDDAKLAFSAIERIMLALVLRRASLIRQHEEVLARLTSQTLTNTVRFRLMDLKGRHWTAWLTPTAKDRLGEVFNQLIHVYHDRDHEFTTQVRELRQQFALTGTGEPRHPSALRHRWQWE